jgi:hypothetical protein
MKTKLNSTLIAMVLVMVAFGTGCHFKHHQVTGSGRRATQKRELPSFTSIATEGAFDVRVTCQKDQSLEIEADDNILPLVTTEVSSNVLHIRTSRSYSIKDDVVVRITVPDLEGLTVSGAGKVDVKNLDNDQFEVALNGAPIIEVSGETQNLKLKANGAGKIDSHKLRATNVSVTSNGVSSVDVYAGETLDVKISGPSHVTYDGDPTVNKTINGPGSLEKKEARGA